MGSIIWIDIRDRYGITQLIFNEAVTKTELVEQARQIGREFVIMATGSVIERSSKNQNLPTGEIEILVVALTIINKSELPPFTIEDETDGGEELRMKYRYLDIRREPVRKNLELRYRMTQEVRKYLDGQNFIEVETPVLIKSTPEGARDFVVPSRLHKGQFYALPQSPQVFKQLLMVAGLDKYYQLVKCFRDEDFRADRQPEFTQIDCEMSFVMSDDILNTFEGLAKHLFQTLKNIDFTAPFPRLTYTDALTYYGTDKPDIRFEMKISEITLLVKGKGFGIADNAEYIGGICAKNCSEYSRKQLDELTEFVKKPQIGAKGLVAVKFNQDGMVKSSIDKFYTQDDLLKWKALFNAENGDLLLILAGEKISTLSALSALRLEMGQRLGLRDKNKFAPLWVTDFPLLEWDQETQRFYAMHHPFTSPNPDDIPLLDTNPADVKALAYDLVINGTEIGGGSIRIHNSDLQQKMFSILGLTQEQAEKQFGFLMNAFKFGAPPHGGIAFGFDRWVALFAGVDSIRDVIAFPKNNAGSDIMIDTPSEISETQLKELF
ncbi:MAG: aspartate--tRNA ligase [Bacteroidia bacterium]|nr:aspartate--tRNA ligase [Bacteroidia bacterium]